MKAEKLKSRITMRPSGHGHYKITIEFRGKEYTRATNNMGAVDAASDNYYGIQRRRFYVTQKQGLLALYNEVKDAHDLR